MTAFNDKRFRYLYIGQAFSGFGDTSLYLTLGIWVKDLTHSNSAAGAVFLALGAPTLLAPVFGQLADRIRRRRVLVSANVAMMIVVCLLLLVHSASSLPLVYAVAFCYGTSFILLDSAGAGLLRDLLDESELASANAALQATNLGLRVIAPVLGAGLYSVAGMPTVILFDVATFVVGIASLLAIHVDETVPAITLGRKAYRELGAGFRQIRSVPALAQIALVAACAAGAMGLVEPIYFAIIGQGLHRTPSFFGVISGVQGAGSVVGGIVTARLIRRYGYARVVGLSILLFTLGSAAFESSTTIVALAGAGAYGIAFVWYLVAFQTSIQAHTPPRLQGRATATGIMVITIPQTIATAAGAGLIHVVHYQLMLIAVMLVTAPSALILLLRPIQDAADHDQARQADLVSGDQVQQRPVPGNCSAGTEAS